MNREANRAGSNRQSWLWKNIAVATLVCHPWLLVVKRLCTKSLLACEAAALVTFLTRQRSGVQVPPAYHLKQPSEIKSRLVASGQQTLTRNVAIEFVSCA